LTLQCHLSYFFSDDDDPTDVDNNHFDTLFGARRFDFGPTSIYGPFARSNISNLGLRMKLKLARNITSFIALSAYWLTSSDDTWTTARISNPADILDNFVGTKIETRVRWELIPKNVRIESGLAHLFATDFMENANKDDVAYLYTQVVFWF